jgi:hypothetical protein
VKKKYNLLLLLVILIIGGVFRWTGLNWDQGFHLHPDERFLTMVVNKSRLPKNLFQYLDPKTSLLNPHNLDFDFFVYGHTPLTFNKIVAVLAQNDTYNQLPLQGRFFSGLADLLIVIIIYKIGQILEQKYKLNSFFKVWACLIYALMVVPIQQSHYFTVDNFLNFFSLMSFYFALLYKNRFKTRYLALSSLFLALAIGSKLTAVLILPLNLWFITNANDRLINLLAKKKDQKIAQALGKLAFEALIFLFFSYLFLRIVDPYLFETASWLDFRPNQQFIQNLKSLKSSEGAEVWYPPAIQWISTKPIIFALKNIVIWGIGPFIALATGFGLTQLIPQLLSLTEIDDNQDKFNLAIVIVWITVYFLYQSTRFVKTIRYFLPLYPFIALIAGYGLTKINQKISQSYRFIVNTIILGLLGLWPLMFLSVYVTPNTRIKASHWVHQHVPDRSTILIEHWDDPLPLSMPQYKKSFTQRELPVFNPDTQKKWEKINSYLKKGDYYILSSNRAWGSITQVPNKYPSMSRYYQDLLSNQTQYKKVAEFTSYPGLKYLGIPVEIKDDQAEEAFTVYDHPKVMIFKNKFAN